MQDELYVYVQSVEDQCGDESHYLRVISMAVLYIPHRIYRHNWFFSLIRKDVLSATIRFYQGWEFSDMVLEVSTTRNP